MSKKMVDVEAVFPCKEQAKKGPTNCPEGYERLIVCIPRKVYTGANAVPRLGSIRTWMRGQTLKKRTIRGSCGIGTPGEYEKTGPMPLLHVVSTTSGRKVLALLTEPQV